METRTRVRTKPPGHALLMARVAVPDVEREFTLAATLWRAIRGYAYG